jgi:hypothetical protein
LITVLATTGTGLAADAVRNSAIPMFATNDRTGWQLDCTFGVDDLLAPPEGGPGPITFDKAHPYFSTLVCAGAASAHWIEARAQEIGDRVNESTRIDPYEVNLSNLEAFKEQLRRDLPPGTPKEDVETYLTRWRIAHHFSGPNSPARSTRNIFYALIEDIAVLPIYRVSLQIDIRLDDHDSVKDIEFMTTY